MVLLKSFLISVILFASLALGHSDDSITAGDNIEVPGLEAAEEKTHLTERRYPARACNCDKNGHGVCKIYKSTGENECVCYPGYGIYEHATTVVCEECKCGTVYQKDYKLRRFGCIFEWGIFSNTKKCFCDAPGYYEKSGICKACLCGERYDGILFNCTSPSSCDCGKGYKLLQDKCQPVDVCSLMPCLNNGQCKNKNYDDGFECICPQGFRGKLCEKVDVCASKSCHNGGHCLNTPSGDGFKCHCKNGFKGKQCEERIGHVCDSNPCLNNGRCVKTSDDFSCECQKGFKGKQCEERVFDVCSIKPCLNNGHCIKTSNDIGFVCECEKGFKGMRCETCDCQCSYESKKTSIID